MTPIEEFKKAYLITEQDIENLVSVKYLAEKNLEDFIAKFYDYLLRFKDTSKYLPDEKTVTRHKDKVKAWFLRLFEGNYNDEYLLTLNKVGETHVKIGLPCHYVNSSMSFARRYTHKLFTDEFGCSKHRDTIVSSIDKILDLNLDVLTISYREEEMRTFVFPPKVEYSLIKFAQKFAFSMDLFLLLVLMLSSLFVLGFVGYEVYSIATGEISVETGILKILGTLLIIWAIGELLSAEINHLKGGKFAITAFLTLAIAAVIRKILIATLSTEKVADILTLGGIVLALGVVYWLIGHSDKS